MRRYLAALAAALVFASQALAGVNIGSYTLAARQITTALTGEAQTAITDLDGATAASITASFSYGSGGSTALAVVQTSCDGGTVWLDIAAFAFTTAAAVKYANLSGLTAKSVGAYAALSTDGVNDGLLCPQLRAVLTTTGTYANTVLTIRISVR